MDLLQELQKEFMQEAAITRKFLNLIPEDRYEWGPHPKSMKIKQLATHIAEIPAWIKMAIDTEGLDFAQNDYTPTPIANNQDLLALFEKSVQEGKNTLDSVNESCFTEPWHLRYGDKILWEGNRYEMIRVSFSQIIHHRAQLGVYLRLLHIPIPGSYGPSADEESF